MNRELTIKCVKDTNGKWPFGFYERYAHWDSVLGWNLVKGEAVYYKEFEAICEELMNKEEEKIPKYWDGVEDIEVGMIVGVDTKEVHGEVVYKEDGNYCLKSEYGLIVCGAGRMVSTLPNKRDMFADMILQEITGTSLAFAYDTTWDIKEVAALCYDKLTTGENIDTK